MEPDAQDELITQKIYEVKKVEGRWKIKSDEELLTETECSECLNESTKNNYGGWIVCDDCFYELVVEPEVKRRMEEE